MAGLLKATWILAAAVYCSGILSAAVGSSSKCSLGCSKLGPTQPLGANVTLWIIFNYTATISSSTPHVTWSHPFEPSLTLSGKLVQLNDSLFNASLQIYLDSYDKFGQYLIKIDGALFETFRIIELDTHCISQQPRLVHINSSVVIPSFPGLNVTLRCDLRGYGPDLAENIEWSDTEGENLDPTRFIPVEQMETQQNKNCSFYHQLVIMNATPADSSVYSCTLYDDDNKIGSLTTALTIIGLPQFIYAPADQSIGLSDTITFHYIISGNRDYINPQFTINGLPLSHYCSQPQCSFSVSSLDNPIRVILMVHIDSDVLSPDLYTVQAAAYLTSNVSTYYAEQFNKHPAYSARSLVRVQTGANVAIAAGFTSAALIVTCMAMFVLVVIVIIYFKQCRSGYARLSDRKCSLLVPTNSEFLCVIDRGQTGRQKSDILSELTDISKDGRTQAFRKVFIVYFNEDPAKIEDLCDILNNLTKLTPRRSFVCDCDIQHRDEVGNDWSNWTVQQIREADIVLLVCSPQLHACLSQVKDPPPIQTATGLVSASAIANLCSILRDSSGKFIPVFLNRPINTNLVPMSLFGRRAYHVNTIGLMAIQTVGLCEEEFVLVVRSYLVNHKDDEARDLIDLVGCLQRV